MIASRRLANALAGASALWERVWPRLWPSLAVAGLFAAVALLDVLPLLSYWGHALVLVGFIVALLFSALPIGGIDWRVDESTIRRRLERDSGLAHRPLTAVDDTLSTGDEALWAAHRARMAKQVRALDVALPAPGMARRDPYAVRFVPVLALAVALAVGHGDMGPRFARAVSPAWGAEGIGATVDLWITPPRYVSRPPVHLHGGETSAQAVEVPESSKVLAQVSGLDERPRLAVGERDGGAFDAVADGAWRKETTIDAGERIAVTNAAGDVLAAWPVRVIPDRPPEASFAADPEAVGETRFRLRYAARDDYGIAEVRAIIARPDGEPAPDGAARLSLKMPRPTEKKPERAGTHDLTAHPWAGAPVLAQIEVEDHAGQTAITEARPLKLPERTFRHPVARMIITERKRLLSTSLEERSAVVDNLADIAAVPESFDDDVVVYLTLRAARARLIYEPEQVGSVMALLWRVALRLEDGGLGIAEQALRDARRKLAEALERGADGPELERLMADLEARMQNYLRALSDQLARKGMTTQSQGPVQDLFGDLMEAIRDMIRMGDAEAAERLLERMAQGMDRVGEAMRGGASREEVAKFRAALATLKKLIAEQRGLLDRTHARTRETRFPDLAPKAQEQEALRRELGGLMVDFYDLMKTIPDELGKAERAMSYASKALMRSNAKGGIAAQGRALDHLRKALETIAEQLAKSLGGVAGASPGSRAGPFGRDPTGNLDLPSRAERKRVREILRELRRRAGDSRRSQEERDYIERLLKRF